MFAAGLIALAFSACDSPPLFYPDSPAEEKPQYTGTYDLNGVTGTTPQPDTVVKGQTVRLPGTGLGYVGSGVVSWCTRERNDVGKAGESYEPEGDITLYAKWDGKNYINLTFPALSWGSGWEYIVNQPKNTHTITANTDILQFQAINRAAQNYAMYASY
jgi:hypothetical protein